jgi:hypothetical protein
MGPILQLNPARVTHQNASGPHDSSNAYVTQWSVALLHTMPCVACVVSVAVVMTRKFFELRTHRLL